MSKKDIHGQKFKAGKPKSTIPKSRADRNLEKIRKQRESSEAPKGKAVTPPAKAVKPPSVFKMIKSFGKDLSAYVKAGAPSCSEKDYKERLLTCDACPHLMRNMMRCGKCGCLVEHKAKWKTTTCPDSKWKAQDLSNLPKPKPKTGDKK
jgi:hypothetical protein